MAAGVAPAAPAREAEWGGAGARTVCRVRAELHPHSRCAARVGLARRGRDGGSGGGEGRDFQVALTPPKPGRSRWSPHGLWCPGGRRGENCQVSRAGCALAPGLAAPGGPRLSLPLGFTEGPGTGACPGSGAASPPWGRAPQNQAARALSALWLPPPYGSA